MGALVIAALVSGLVLRLALPGHFTFLGDEAWTFDHVQDARHGGSWSTLGMPSSRGVKNAGMSVWVFILLGIVGDVSTPAGLTRAVAMFALLGHAMMLLVPRWIVKDENEKQTWLWAFVLAATNPILVFLERKIWAQSVLPFFQMGLILAWMRRDTRVGAFVWGVLSAIVGQIHMGGFFFAPMLALFTRLLSPKRPVRWGSWFAGGVFGTVPALPWLLYLVHDRPPPTSSGSQLLRFRLEFYQYFFSDPSGLCFEYFFGKDTLRSLKYPVFFGHATYLVLLACMALAVASGAVAVIAVRALVLRLRERAGLREFLTGNGSDTTILVVATLAGMGVAMTLPSISIHRHYMLAAFPVPYLFVAQTALRSSRGERWLATLFAGCLVVSIGMLSFLHLNGGADGFGKSWALQVQEGTSPDRAATFRPPVTESAP